MGHGGRDSPISPLAVLRPNAGIARYFKMTANPGWLVPNSGGGEVIHDPRVEIRLLTCEGKDARLLHEGAHI